MREMMIDRTDLRPIIAAMRDGTYAPTVPRDLLDQKLVRKITSNDGSTTETDSTEAIDVWRQIKPERNALIAIFAQEAWESFAAARKQLDYEIDHSRPVHDAAFLEDWCIRMISHSFQQWGARRDARLVRANGEWDVPDRLYDRFRAIIDFGHTNMIVNDSPASFMERGIGTASTVTWRLAKMVPRLAVRDSVPMTKQQVLDCLRRSYSTVVVQFMSLHQYIAVPLISALQTSDGFDMSLFSLEPISGGYKLTIDHTKLLAMRDKEGNRIFDRQLTSETTWCPARYSTGEGQSMLQGYFDWVVSIAGRNYAPIAELPDHVPTSK